MFITVDVLLSETISGMRLSRSVNGSAPEEGEEYRLFSVLVKLRGRQEKLRFAVAEGGGLKVSVMFKFHLGVQNIVFTMAKRRTRGCVNTAGKA